MQEPAEYCDRCKLPDLHALGLQFFHGEHCAKRERTVLAPGDAGNPLLRVYHNGSTENFLRVKARLKKMTKGKDRGESKKKAGER